MRAQVSFNEIKGTAAVSWLLLQFQDHRTSRCCSSAGAFWLAPALWSWGSSKHLKPRKKRRNPNPTIGKLCNGFSISFWLISVLWPGCLPSPRCVPSPKASINVITWCICQKSTKTFKTCEQSLEVAAEHQSCWKGTKCSSPLALNIKWQQQEDVGYQTTLEAPKLHKKRFRGICRPQFMQIQTPDSQ